MSRFESGQVGKTIISQIGYNNLMCFGAYGSIKYFDGDDQTNDGGLIFKARNNPIVTEDANVKVTLDFNDTYSVSINGVISKKEYLNVSGIYCDQLTDLIYEIIGY